MNAKNLILVALLSMIFFHLKAQVVKVDGGKYSIPIQIDTTNSENIWEYGISEKNILTDTDSVLITSLNEDYPPNSKSSFKFSFNNKDLFNWGFFVMIGWEEQLDVESAKDGGIVDISFDLEETWQNIFEYQNDKFNVWHLNESTALHNGELGRTNTEKLRYTGMCFGPNFYFDNDFVSVRFTFISDSIDTQQEGWMIKNLIVDGTTIDNIEPYTAQSLVKIQPNPASSQISISLPQTWQQADFCLYNLTGQLFFQKNEYTNTQNINLSNLPAGNYVAELRSKQGLLFERLIIQ